MISKTTKKDKYGWYYTFRKHKDGTLIIQQKNSPEKYNEIYVFGTGVLDILKEVVNSKPSVVRDEKSIIK